MDDLLRMSKAHLAEAQNESAPSPAQLLRARVQHALHEEYDTRWRERLTEPTVLRFLEDERGDVDRATRRVLAWFRWREEYHVDHLVQSRLQLDGLPLLMALYWPGCLIGHDHEGTPVQFTRFSCVDFASLVRHRMVEAAVRHSVYLNELAAEQNPSGRMVFIFDLGADEHELAAVKHDTEFVRCALIFLREMAKVYGAYYPRATKRVLVTRAPSFFWLAWRTVRTFGEFFPQSVEPRLRVFNDAALPQLLNYMPLATVPTCLGGRNPCYAMLSTGGYLQQQRPGGCVSQLRVNPWSPSLRAQPPEGGSLRLWQPSSKPLGDQIEELSADSPKWSNPATPSFSEVPTVRAELQAVPGKPPLATPPPNAPDSEHRRLDQTLTRTRTRTPALCPPTNPNPNPNPSPMPAEALVSEHRRLDEHALAQTKPDPEPQPQPEPNPHPKSSPPHPTPYLPLTYTPNA